MRLASISHEDRDLVVVDLGNRRLADVNDVLKAATDAGTRPPVHSMQQLAEADDTLLDTLQSGVSSLAGDPAMGINAAEVRWYPPLRHPGKVCGVAMNNSASNERKISAPAHPAFFLKPPSCLIGHLEPIRVRPYYGSVHPEPELALVIGKTTRDVPASRALESVFGYTIFNDVTSNGMRAEDMFHYWAVYASKNNPDETERVEQHLSYAARYKGTDTFAVMGPWIVTRNDIENPDDLDVRCSVHGETIAEDSTRYYNYKVAEIISFLSYFQTLSPGDVVSLGTAFKPAANRMSIHQANFQIVEGPVEITIEGLGRQRNPIIVDNVELGPWRLP